MKNEKSFRVFVFTSKEERKRFSKEMFWSDLSHLTDAKKNKIRIGRKVAIVCSILTYILYFLYFSLILFTKIRYHISVNIPLELEIYHCFVLIFMTLLLLLCLFFPCGDYYINEFASKIARKKGKLTTPNNYIDFYDTYISYNSLYKITYKHFKYKIVYNRYNFSDNNQEFYLRFMPNDKFDCFYLLKYKDLEKSHIDIDSFLQFLNEKAISS